MTVGGCCDQNGAILHTCLFSMDEYYLYTENILPTKRNCQILVRFYIILVMCCQQQKTCTLPIKCVQKI